MKPTIHDIQKAVSTVFNVQIHDLKGPSRHASIFWPRASAMRLARDLTSQSYHRIGRSFGNRDHSSVMSAVRRAAERSLNDPDFADRFLRSKSIIKNRPADERMLQVQICEVMDENERLSKQVDALTVRLKHIGMIANKEIYDLAE